MQKLWLETLTLHLRIYLKIEILTDEERDLFLCTPRTYTNPRASLQAMEMQLADCFTDYYIPQSVS